MSARLASRVFAAISLMAVATAFAGGPLSVCNTTGGGTPIPVKYPGNGTVNLNYDLGVLGPRTKAVADALVTASVANWTNVATATVSIGRGPDLPVDVTTANSATYLNVFNDGLNPVIYDTDGSIVDQILGVGAKNNVLGFAGSSFTLSGSPPNQTCQYTEGRAVISGFITVSDATFRIVVAHEIGHLIGLDHSQIDNEQGLAPANYPLMYPSAARSTDALHEDDMAAVTALYPEPTMNATYGQITGNLRQVDGLTAVRGGNIWARELSTGKLYSVVSDYLQQNDGFFKLLLPAGTYNLFAGGIRTAHTGGSSVGPYSETSGDPSFQPPLYNGGVRMTAIALGGGAPTPFMIVPGCAATATFRIDGVGSIGGNCGGVTPEVFPLNGVIPAGWINPNSPTTSELITNPGFEAGATGWPSTGTGWAATTGNARTGANQMQFVGDNLEGVVYQTVSIPAGATASLSFWLSIATQETPDGNQYDQMRFEVRNTSDGIIGAGTPFSNLDAGGYGQVLYNLNAFAGQTVRIAFAAFNDEVFPTTFRIDDVSFTATAGAPAWTVATDLVNEGMFSLKSGVPANGSSSDIQYSASFAAGNVSFARRVSSEAGADFLRFYIDNVLQGEWSGEVAFSTVTFPMTAGSHTLRWSYQKSAAGSAGSDAAWIDSVVLPNVAATDTTPDAFTFTDATNVTLGATVTSNAITVGGINAAAAISVTGGSYSIGCTGTFTTVAATISNGETVCVRHVASGSFSTTTDTVLTIGGVSDTFTSTTVAADTTPNTFTFTDVTNVALGSVQTSNAITVGGINAAAAISVAGGTYSIGCTGTFTAVAGTITNGQAVCVRHTASATPATATDTVLTIGGVSDTFTSTTVAADTTPNTFTFTDVTDVALGSVQTSNAITVGGINAAAAISVAGGTYSIGCTGTFTGVAGTITNGQTVCVRHTASAGLATATDTLLTIGGVSDTFTSTTVAADTTPNAFTFTDVTNVTPGAVQTSNAITVGGISAAAAISVTGGTYSVGCTGTFTAVAGTISNGQTVCVRHTAPLVLSAITSTALTIGGVSDAFSSTTVASLPPTADFDNDGIPNSVEAPESRNPFLKDNDVFGNSRLFAMQQYRDFLGREADPAGATLWTNQTASGAMTRAQVVEAFFDSQEFQNGLPQITRLYFAFFDRIADYPGLLFHAGRYRVGVPLNTIAQDFAGSEEFLITYGSLTNGQYVDLVYQNVLGRPADPAGRANALAQLDNNILTRGELMVAFSESQEHINLSGPDVFVTAIYVGMLRRSPDVVGLQNWVGAFAGGLPRTQMLQAFLDSQEYHNRFLP